MTELSQRFYKKGCQFLGVKYPYLCGAMTWISEPKLVAAVSEAGGFGCLAGGNTPIDILERQIEETRGLTSKPFGVNLVTISPAFPEQIERIAKMGLEYVIFAGGIPRKADIAAVKAGGSRVICFASTKMLARKMIRSGADALIIEGAEAGGHIGNVSLAVLLQQVLFEVDDVPVFVAGGIATGRMAAHLFMMGAAGVQLGTRFVVATECIAHENFKRVILKANARDAQATSQFDVALPVVPVRTIKNKGVEEFTKLQFDLIRQIYDNEIERAEAQEQLESFWMGALRKAAVEGNVEYGSLMAGQSVGLVTKEESVADIIRDLDMEAEAEFRAVRKSLL